MTTLVVDKILPQSGTSIQIGDSEIHNYCSRWSNFRKFRNKLVLDHLELLELKLHHLESQAQSGSNWQEMQFMRNTYTASSTSNKLLFICQMTIAINATTCAF